MGIYPYARQAPICGTGMGVDVPSFAAEVPVQFHLFLLI
jgi:hypothetical protein